MYRPDEDIDRLSREAAEHYNAPGKSDWDALRQTLDKEMPLEKEKKRRGFLFFFLMALGLSLAGSAIWYGVHKRAAVTDDVIAANNAQPKNNTAGTENTPGTVSDKQITESIPAKPAAIEKSTSTIAAKEKSAPVSTSAHTTITDKNNLPVGSAPTAASTQAHLNKVAATKNPLQKKMPAAGNSFLTATVNASGSKGKNGTLRHAPVAVENSSSPANAGNQLLVKGRKDKNKGTRLINDQEKNETATADTNEVSAKEDINNNKTIPAEVPAIAAVPEAKLPAVAKHTVATQPVAAVETKTDSAKPAAVKVKNKSKKSTAILLGLTGGVDMSTVKFTYGSNIGYNIGFMGGYQFGPHWSAYTGIIYTKKNYKLNGSDYNPPKHYWTQYVQLETVDGYCRMWEVPLLARYTFNPQAKTAFFASAGMSSYFMKEQQYDYNYKTSTGASMTTPWNNDSTYNHVFSILDLSFGVQKQIGKHLNWQIEPYARIPLGGVGFGNIKLSSFGVNFTLQYKQPLKR